LADPNVCLEISDDLQRVLLNRLQECIGQWELLARGIPRDASTGRWAFDRLGGALRAAARSVEQSLRHSASLTQRVSSCLSEAVEWARSVPSELLVLSYQPDVPDVDHGRILLHSDRRERGAAILSLPLYQPRFGEHELWLLQGGSAMAGNLKHWRKMLETHRSYAYEYARLLTTDPRDVVSKRKLKDEQSKIAAAKSTLDELGASTPADPIDTYDPDEDAGMQRFQQAAPGLNARLSSLEQRDENKAPDETAKPVTSPPASASNQEFHRELKIVREQMDHYCQALADPNVHIAISAPLRQMVIHRIEELLGQLEGLRRRYRRGLADETMNRLNRIEGSLRTAAKLAKQTSSKTDPREEIHSHLAECLRRIDAMLRLNES
jgi:hypothetical protein